MYFCFISLLISNLTDNQMWGMEFEGYTILEDDYYYSILSKKGDWKYDGPHSFVSHSPFVHTYN